MTGVIRKKQVGEAWETVLDTDSGGSYTPPTEHEFVQWAVTADGVYVKATWTKSGGGDLLDLTTPTVPLILVSGIYAITGDFTWQGGPSPGDGAECQIGSDSLGYANVFGIDFGAPVPDDPIPGIPVWIAYMPAGTDLYMKALQSTGSPGNFVGAGWLQRIT